MSTAILSQIQGAAGVRIGLNPILGEIAMAVTEVNGSYLGTSIEITDKGTRLGRKYRMRATLFVVVAASLWGVSGVATQALFTRYGVSPLWLVSVRMLSAGLALSIAGFAKGRNGVYRSIFSHPGDRWRILAFAIFGLGAVQLTYFLAIAGGNVVSATVLQYLGPIILTIYVAIRTLRFPGIREVLALLLALAGTVLLLTNGHLSSLTIPVRGVIWGLVAAGAGAFYTYFPKPLVRKYGSRPVLSLSLLIGGVGFSPFLMRRPPALNVDALLLLGFIILGGTIVSFSLYLSALAYLEPVETSIISCSEPLSAALVGVTLLGIPLGPLGAIGGLATLIAVVILATSRVQPVEIPPG